MLKKAVSVFPVSAWQGETAGAGNIWRAFCPKERQRKQ